jgi:hypothetical protein
VYDSLRVSREIKGEAGAMMTIPIKIGHAGALEGMSGICRDAAPPWLCTSLTCLRRKSALHHKAMEPVITPVGYR